MLDREVVEAFLDCEFEEGDWEVPKDIPKEALVEAFCQYVEDDYYINLRRIFISLSWIWD